MYRPDLAKIPAKIPVLSVSWTGAKRKTSGKKWGFRQEPHNLRLEKAVECAFRLLT